MYGELNYCEVSMMLVFTLDCNVALLKTSSQLRFVKSDLHAHMSHVSIGDTSGHHVHSSLG